MNKILFFIKKIIPEKLFKKIQPFYHYSMGFLAALVYGFPSRKLKVIGVTGTSGKTTTVFMCAHILKNAGIKLGYTSTALFSDGKKEWLNNRKMTMLGRLFTQKMLAKMVRNGCTHAIIETTSEGIVQYRHRFINYDTLLFTNLYPEHIESHGGFENYKKAKGDLFKHLKNCSHKKNKDSSLVKKIIIANTDDKHASFFLNFWADEKLTFSTNNPHQKLSSDKNFKKIKNNTACNIVQTKTGVAFTLDNTSFITRILGTFNITNVLAAITLAQTENINKEIIKKSVSMLTNAPGRLERIEEGQNFTIIVDYAFEPNALTKLYETIAVIPYKNIIHVLGGTGGGRDTWRRPEIGKIAGSRAHYVIVTNEDPYNEDPRVIMDAVKSGAIESGKEENINLFSILDRKQAIKKALTLAQKEDIILITGKGSEQAICGPDGTMTPWDDREITRELLQEIKIK